RRVRVAGPHAPAAAQNAEDLFVVMVMVGRSPRRNAADELCDDGVDYWGGGLGEACGHLTRSLRSLATDYRAIPAVGGRTRFLIAKTHRRCGRRVRHGRSTKRRIARIGAA